MVSGKPPRRSKTTEEPVIIDLTATEVAQDKPAVEAAASIPAPEDPPTHHEPTSEAPKPEVEATVSLENEVPLAAEHPDPKPEPETASEPHPAQSEKPSGSMFGSDTSVQDEEQVRDQPESPRPQSSITSSLLAAGIAGGLIALIGAGALQYAGVLPSVGANANADKIAALSAEVETLKTAPKAADTSALEARLAKLESNPQQSTAIDPSAISDLQAKIASTNQAIDQLKSDVTGRIQGLTSGQSGLSDSLSAIQAKLNKPRDDIEVARAIAASALKTAADRGGPFLAELRTLGSIAPEDPAIAALEPYATTGAVSRAELLQRFNGVADTILSAINQPAESANIGERLLASAMSVIKVRPVGNVAGDSPSAIVARMEDKIRNGDLKGASAEWDTLPEVGRTVSAGFKKTLDARIAVEAQVSDALARSVAGRQG
ncbi:mitofilin family membrane protein [Rhizobium sp.]|jgi:hypothetical protein|uniref:COG4223 family protein n=1 Tax=Rhizobium sp. TaxID=391 RepID=UPI000E9F4F53|nr:hypothetical protein [Rhizobium sp.]